MNIDKTIAKLDLKHLLDSLLEMKISLDSHAIEIWTEKNSEAFFKLVSSILDTVRLSFFLKDISCCENRKITEYSINSKLKKCGEMTSYSVIDCADGKKIPMKTDFRKTIEKHYFFEWVKFVLDDSTTDKNKPLVWHDEHKNEPLYFDKDDELPEVFYTPFIDLMKKLAGIED